ncbi:MAG: potassium transporter Kup [Gemmatimonadales bacterium]|nr:potassium transporter Kup [Gemmatimonadales bacterium]
MGVAFRRRRPTSVSASSKAPPSGRALATLALGALGVVYGDIGTSPLYALKECFSGPHGFPVTPENVLGILSLIFWALNFVVTFKYLTMVMRADNRGEGGILALLALGRPSGQPTRTGRLLIVVGLFGAALLYGDGIITPAISVLGAMEGLTVAAPALERWVVPISFVIILGLFSFQRRGTAGVGAVFGPVTAVWFISIAILGVHGIMREPSVLRALNPWYAAEFFLREGLTGFTVLGAIILVVTGGEALYADMGHFGRRPMRLAWFGAVLPALVLNYFGQGAYLLHDPATARNPFYSLVPSWALYPMVAIATGAAVVASQALISGAFSLTRQAVQLGFSPRVNIIHTSRTEIGQIYIPQVNNLLMVACLGLVLGFRTSSNLAATYGVALSMTMTITSILFAVVARKRWGWSWWKVGTLTALFLAVDLAFVGANLLKVPHGGWFPLVVAGLVYALMSTWKKGRVRLAELVRENTLPMDLFLQDIERRQPHRVQGTAVFLTSDASGAPPVLLHHLKHNQVLHEKVMLMSIVTEEIPQVDPEDRVQCKELGAGFYQVIAHYGFMETPDVPTILQSLGQNDGDGKPVSVKLTTTTFYLGRETLIASDGRGPRRGGALPPAARPAPERMARWRKRLFVVMTRNAQSATAFFGLPPNRVVELGAQIQF